MRRRLSVMGLALLAAWWRAAPRQRSFAGKYSVIGRCGESVAVTSLARAPGAEQALAYAVQRVKSAFPRGLVRADVDTCGLVL